MINTNIVTDNLDYGNIPCGIVIFEKDDLKIVYSNDIYKKIFATDTNEYFNVYIDDTKRITKSIKSEADDGSVTEYRFIDKKGKMNCAYLGLRSLNENYCLGAVFADTVSQGVYRVYKEALTNDKIMVMEVDIETDICRIVCSGIGESIIIADFTENALKTVFETEADVEYILKQQKSDESYTLRIRLNESGQWQWYVLYKNIVCDEQGKPIRIVGALCNIDSQKKTEQNLISKIETDPLTKVYSREIGKEKIDNFLALRTRNQDYALFVLDLDNFKVINDSFGHLYGDAVLTMAASSIKSSVDKDDIVGRFGGDEFFVVIKNSDYDTIISKAGKISKSILNMRTNISNDNDISCSIGIAFAEDEDDTYGELFRKADIALYKSKNSGKNRITIYTDDMHGEQGGGVCYEQEDANENKTQSHDLTQVAIEIAARSTSFQNAVHMIMSHIGLSLDVDDVKIMRVNYADDKVSIEHHWNKEENVAKRDNRTGYYLHDDVVNLRKRFENQPLFVVNEMTREEFTEKFRKELDKISEKSVIYTSSLTQEQSFYYMILSSFTKNRQWTDEQKKMISDITKILFVYLKKSQSEIIEEDDDPLSIEPHTKLLYFDKFFVEAGKIRKKATENNQKVAVVYTDFYNINLFRKRYGTRNSQKVLINYATSINKKNKKYEDMFITTHVYGTEQFISLIRYNGELKDLADKILKFNKRICVQQQVQFPDFNLITETGIGEVEKNVSLEERVDDVRVAKRGKDTPQECIYYIID